MLRVGITSGIGSGKSTVARIFRTLGVPVYFADDEARKLINENEAIRTRIVNHFGKEAYTDGLLNRAFIASKVFADPQELAMLNSITHPPTIEHADKWMQQYTGTGIPFILKEAALLFESGSAGHLDFIIGVQAPMALRIRRIMERDGITAEEVKQRMDRQMDESIKMKLCDAVIINDEQQLLIPQVLDLYELLKNKSAADSVADPSPA